MTSSTDELITAYRAFRSEGMSTVRSAAQLREMFNLTIDEAKDVVVRAETGVAADQHQAETILRALEGIEPGFDDDDVIGPPHGYRARDVDWLRPPKVEGQEGAWTSRWDLELRDGPTSRAVFDAPADVRPELRHAHVEPVDARHAVLELVSVEHPLDVACYLLIDAVLRWIDTEFGIVRINDSDRDTWRTFRERRDGR